MKWRLDITLKSELCASSGDSGEGLIDTKIAMEEGIPVIPARRIKGALLAEGKEMASCHWINPVSLERLFGARGASRPGAMRIGNAYLRIIPQGALGNSCPAQEIEISDYKKVMASIKSLPDFNEMLLERFLTVERTRTAIDTDSGAADRTSLRTMQLVPRGLVFSGEVELDEDIPPECIETLEYCVKALRHLGAGVTRGLGEVSCALEKSESQGKHPDISDPEAFWDMEEIVEAAYEIELITPVLFPGENGMYEDCGEQIPGAAVLGTLAGMYLQDYQLGKEAHEDPDFQRIFLRDGVKFGYGFPLNGNRVFYPCPAHFSGIKNRREQIVNRFADENGEVRRTSVSGQVCWEADKVYTSSVKKELRMHHARPQDRGIGHALHGRVKNADADMGQLFQYVCLSQGQKFRGILQGRAGDLKKLADCLEKRNGRILLGRSRSAEYGQAEMVIHRRYLKASDKKEGGKRKTEFLIWFVTPMVLKDKNGEISPEPDIFIRMLKNRLGRTENLEYVNHIAVYTRTGGYNSKWRLPVPQYAAFEKGTVFIIRTAADLSGLESVRWGEMTGKGYGQIRIIPFQRNKKFYNRVEFSDESQEDEAIRSEFAAAFQKWNVERKKKMQVKQEAVKVAEALTKLPSSGRIEQIIRLSQHRENYAQIMEDIEGMKKSGGQEEKNSSYESIREFLKPCEKQEMFFLQCYLQAAKMKARSEEVSK